jgi:hypothetical protein
MTTTWQLPVSSSSDSATCADNAAPWADSVPVTDPPTGSAAGSAADPADSAAGSVSGDVAPWSDLPRRTLEKQELKDLVDALATRPELWQAEVAYSNSDRHYASLYRDEHVDIWLLCWTPENDTGWHDHDISSGAVRVVDGALHEHNPRIGGEHLEIEVPAGNSFCFGPDHIHRLTGSTETAVSIHAYSPPLWRLGQYSINDGGVMRRLPASYAEELRPL